MIHSLYVFSLSISVASLSSSQTLDKNTSTSCPLFHFGPSDAFRTTGHVRISNLSSSPSGNSVGIGFERSEEHTSELQSRGHLVCRLLLEKKKKATKHALQIHTT